VTVPEQGLTPQTAEVVDSIVAGAQAGSRAPALIAGVIRCGEVAHVSAAGDSPLPHRDLQFRLGSITKTLTAALVLSLRDEGRLDLDDPVTTLLPGCDLPGVRVRELLGHASGMQREPDGLWWERHPGGSLPSLLAGVSTSKLAFGRYQRFHYSNLAYGLLGGIVAGLTGQRWSEAVATRLLTPLGMHRTSYQAQEPFARGYVVHPWHQTLREEPREDAGAMAPAGQLWSTVDDLARFAAALAGTGPGVDVLPKATVAEMSAPVVLADLEGWTHGYGLGLQLWRSGERVYIGHTGSMPGYLAVLVVHRRSGTGVVAFANTYSLPGTGIGKLGISVLDAVLSGEPVPVARWQAAAPPPAEVATLCGRWWWMGREFEARWDGALVLRGTAPGAESWRFTKEAPDRWRGQTGEQAGEILAVLRDPDGAVTGLDIATFVFRREPMTD
jgi:CubicO group peptidase (beta-lactamase class C family)